MTFLRLIPLEDTVVFPSMGITLTVDAGADERVVLVPRHGNEFLEVGVVAEVSEQVRLPGGGRAIALSGLHRALIGAAETGPDGELRVEVSERPDAVPIDGKTRDLEREYRAVVGCRCGDAIEYWLPDALLPRQQLLSAVARRRAA